MAATAATSVTLRERPWLVKMVKLSALVADATETLTHGGPAITPDRVTFNWTKAPTILCNATGYHLKASDSTTTVAVKLVPAVGGDLAGAEVEVEIHFYGIAAGGLT